VLLTNCAIGDKETAMKTVAAQLITFTEDELHDYVEEMNQAGLTPDLAIRDAKGVQVLASRTAPGG
jgi:hypothetical protein